MEEEYYLSQEEDAATVCKCYDSVIKTRINVTPFIPYFYDYDHSEDN